MLDKTHSVKHSQYTSIIAYALYFFSFFSIITAVCLSFFAPTKIVACRSFDGKSSLLTYARGNSLSNEYSSIGLDVIDLNESISSYKARKQNKIISFEKDIVTDFSQFYQMDAKDYLYYVLPIFLQEYDLRFQSAQETFLDANNLSILSPIFEYDELFINVNGKISLVNAYSTSSIKNFQNLRKLMDLDNEHIIQVSEESIDIKIYNNNTNSFLDDKYIRYTDESGILTYEVRQYEN